MRFFRKCSMFRGTIPLRLEEENIIKDIRKLFRLKKNSITLKLKVTDIINFFVHEE